MRTLREHGSVLVLTLWVLFFLSALAVAIGSYVDGGLKAARSLRGRALGVQLAKTGVERSIALLVTDTNGWDAATELWGDHADNFMDVEWEGGRYSVVSPSDSGEPRPGLRDEESRINISVVELRVLEGLFRSVGEVAVDDAAALAASVADWRDEDEDVLTGGAENAYYRALADPVECHNGKFLSLHELRWVKGMTDEIMARVEPHITIYGSGKVNLNTAGPEVLGALMAAAGGEQAVIDSLVRRVLAFRESGRVFTTADGGAFMQELNSFSTLQREEQSLFAAILGWMHVRSTCFGGTVLAQPYPPAGRTAATPAVTRQVDFVFNRETGRRCHWYEN